MEAQLQIRQNAQEYNDYMKDLFAWEKALKEKPAKRAGPAAAATSSGAAAGPPPPPRGRLGGLRGGISGVGSDDNVRRPGAVDLVAAGAGTSTSSGRQSDGRQPEGAQSGAARGAATHTYANYSRWEKFDIDAALQDTSDGQDGERGAGPRPRAAGTPLVAPGAVPVRGIAPAAAGGARPSGNSADVEPQPARWQLQQEHRQAQEQEHGQEQGRQRQQERRAQPQQQQQPQLPPPLRPQPARPAGDRPRAPSPEPTTAEGWKDRGNKLLQAGHLQEAVACYGRSLGAGPTCLAHANRALAHLKLGDLAAADADATAALALDAGYAKSWQRRGTARARLGRWLDAAQDWEEALRLEPGNKAARAERDACLKRHLAAAGVRRAAPRRALRIEEDDGAAAGVGGGGGGTAVTDSAGAGASHATRSKPTPSAAAAGVQGTGTEQVVESLHGTDAITPAAASSLGVARGTGAAGKTVVLKVVTAAGPRTPSPIAAAAAALAPRRGPSPDGAQSAPATAAAAGSAPTAAAPSASPAAAPPRSPHQEHQEQRRLSVTAAAAAASCALAERMARSLRPPRNGIEFESAWRSLRGDATLQEHYLSLLPPEQLPTVFRESMTPQVLVSVTRAALAAAAAGDNDEGGGDAIPAAETEQETMDRRPLRPAAAVGLLEGLSKVPRFATMAMCLGPKDKAGLRELWDAAAAHLASPEALRLNALRATFRV